MTEIETGVLSELKIAEVQCPLVEALKTIVDYSRTTAPCHSHEIKELVVQLTKAIIKKHGAGEKEE